MQIRALFLWLANEQKEGDCREDHGVFARPPVCSTVLGGKSSLSKRLGRRAGIAA